MADSEQSTSYGALRLIATLLRALAWFNLTVGGIGTVVATATVARDSANTGLTILTLIGGVLATLFTTIFLFAFADLIFVMLDIEQNTADTADSLDRLQQASGQEARPHFRRR